MAERLRFLPAGEGGVLVELPDLAVTLALYDGLRMARPAGVAELIPAARTLMVQFDPSVIGRAAIISTISQIDLSRHSPRRSATFEIDVVYDGEDLGAVADMLGCSVDEVIRRHTGTTYTVAFNGFAPGFSYMTCDDRSLEVPRRKSPRVRVPAGSVALGGNFCGVYPSDSPGGWQLLGRTAAKMWDTSRARAAMLVPGDRVRFRRAQKASVKQPEAAAGPAVSRHAAGLLVTRADRPALYQDLGRRGHADQGVGASGALDRTSFVEANLCVGNPPGAAALEVTLGGFALKTDRAVTLAVTGAPTALALRAPDGRRQWAPFGRPFTLDPGDELTLDAPTSGARSYIALRGGFSVADLLGSASTDTLAKLGPMPLVQGAILEPACAPAAKVDMARPPPKRMPRPDEIVALDVYLGPRTDWFTERSIALLFKQEWRVTAESSRIGIRLAGAEPLEKSTDAELASEATVVGSIQVPHNGQPVLFLADHPLTGGYPVIGVVARHHLDLAGQLPGGARIRFRAIAPFVEG